MCKTGFLTGNFMNKTLVCLIAETRASAITWPGIKSFVLDSLRADLLLCISVPEKYDFANPLWQFAKYRYSTPEFNDWGDAFDEVQQAQMQPAKDETLPDWRQLLEIKSQWLGGVKGPGQHAGSAAILIYYRWLLLKFLQSEGLLDRYDRFVLTRSDFVWTTHHPPMSALDPQAIWIPDGEGYMGLTDRHAVLSRENIEIYLDIISPIVKEPNILFSEMKHKNNWNLEQFIDYSLARRKCRDKVRHFPYVMYSAREWGGTTSWSQGNWSDEFGYYIKYKSEFESATSAQKVIKTKSDWSGIFTPKSGRGFKSAVLDEFGNPIAVVGRILQTSNPSSINSESVLLSIDYSGNSGFLYTSRALLGHHERKLVDEVELTEIKPDYYHLLSKRERELYYTLNTEGTLIKSTSDPHSFRIQNRYLQEKGAAMSLGD